MMQGMTIVVIALAGSLSCKPLNLEYTSSYVDIHVLCNGPIPIMNLVSLRKTHFIGW
jgi:hypothetical protein